MQLKVEGARSCRNHRVVQFKCKEKLLEDFKEKRELGSLLQKIRLNLYWSIYSVTLQMFGKEGSGSRNAS